MSRFGQARTWLRAVLFRGNAEREMHAEMAAHIAQAAERFVARGMSERDALYAARREFGAASVIQEQARDTRGGRWVNEITTDVKYAMRYFARTPLTSLTIVFTLLLGIGLNAAAYSFGQGYLYNPPPGIPNDASLLALRGTERYDGRLQKRSFSFPELQDYAAQPVFASVAGWATTSLVMDFGDGDEGITGAVGMYVTPNYFSTLNLRLAAGPGFLQSRFDDINNAELTTVVTYAFATSQYGTAASAIGKRLRVNDAIVTIVGVAPRRFIGVEPFTSRRLLFLPLSAFPIIEHVNASAYSSADSSLFRAVARVRPDVDVRSVQPIVANIATRNLASRPAEEHISDRTTFAPRLRGLGDVDTRPGQAVAVTLSFALLDLLILLVCLTTVSSLLVGAAVTRRHEIGVRLALGASRWRIVRQLLTETSILALLGAAGGLALYVMLTRAAFVARMPIDVAPTWHAALFTALFAVSVTMFCGLSPALHATRQGLSDVLKSSSLGATSRSRMQRLFVVAQIAFAQPLLVLLGMNIVSFYKETGSPTDTKMADKLIVADFNRYAGRDHAQNDAAIAAISRRLSGVPGVLGVILRPNSVSMYTARPIESTGLNTSNKSFALRVNNVTTEYLELLGIKVVAGRTLIPADTLDNVQRLIVRADFASRVFGGGNPIGRRVCSYACTRKSDTMEVVGVVAMSAPGLNKDDRQVQAFTLRTASESPSLLIRTNVNAGAVVPAIRAIARAEAPRLPIVAVQTMAELDAKEQETLVQVSSATAGAGLLTLLLGCIGLYAVVALAVGQRRREIGIRIALGASPSEVITLFFKGGLRLSAIGLAIGLILSAAVIRMLSGPMRGIDANPVVVATAIATIVLLVASVATWLPARKAAGVDPLSALRAE
ncbi:MAG: FtsX-like permease family protein [Gemmatimonadaceae bacterium]